MAPRIGMIAGSTIRGTAALCAAALAVTCILALSVAASAHADETVWSCGNFGNGVFGHAAVFGINTPASCPGNPYGTDGLTIATAGNTVAAGKRASWQATAPAGLVIGGAWVPPGQMASNGINDGHQYGGGFYWAGGGAATQDLQTTAAFSNLSSGYFGWQVICGANPCTSNYNWISVAEVALDVRETVGPSLVAPDGLWQASGWVRGDWTLHYYGDSPSGLCSLSASLNGQAIPGSSSTANPSVWHQCAAPAVSATVHTAIYGQGAVPLTLGASDAAGVPASVSKTVFIDNTQPTVSLSGPTDAPSTAGVQYVTATATAGASQVDGIDCSVDGAPARWVAGPSARVPVSGLGQHSVGCAAANNAVDGAGNHGWSDWSSWTLSIRQPTLAAISFGSRIINALLCRRARERVTVPARWVTVRRNGKLVKVKRPSYTRIVGVIRCQPRVVRVRVRVRVDGRWQWRWERQVLLPHTVQRSTWRARHGATTTVVGWLGTSIGNALGGQPVRILTAPDNGSGAFTQATIATSSADGSWSARLPAGPSRLVQAVYDGASTVEPTSSVQIRVIVPASVKLLSVSPHHVGWGETVRIVGQLLGGYLPAAGTLVRLRIGFGSGYTTYGVQEHVAGSGRFSTTYTFGAGIPGVRRRYWFQIASLPVGDYPYAPANSRRITVIVGG